MIECHLVSFAPKARLLVATKRRVCTVRVVAVDPNAPGLNGTRHGVCLVHVSRPHARAQPVYSIVGNGDSLLLRLEGDYACDRPKDLLLEDTHLVSSREYGRLNVEAAVHHIIGRSPCKHCGAFLHPQIDVVGDAIVLRLRHLCAHHGGGVQRITCLDRLSPLDNTLHEPLVDVLLHQQPALACAHLALVESKHHGTLHGLIEESVVAIAHRLEEDVGALSA
mmetsp:Transcript_20963/g.34628  ORF Transcript_20963/g.34628 Transcript_20963/m.34628 type:complete len:222 (-) Transcript_20963:853-1518(-)